jgi:pimeloyl-ACP methyl ester carboxylesterase
LKLKAGGWRCENTAAGERRRVAGYAATDLIKRHEALPDPLIGKNDPFFLPPGAEAFKRDIPEATVRFFDTGHFALETHAGEIAATIREFLARSLKAR